jgi:hypothetical protein
LINPGAEEECNGIDDNCTGDEDDATDAPTWYRDADGDGYGDPDTYRAACDQPAGSVDNGADCDDSEGSIHPGATEVCDGLDNNCSGDESDAVDPVSWYADGDSDGYGAGAVLATACTGPAGSVDNNTDCDDADAAVIDGSLWEVDADGDGFSGETRACTDPGGTPGYFTGDCDDSDVHVHPGAWDDPDDGIDNDCDGAIDMADAETASTTKLSLADDSVSAITWTTPVDFCGGSYTSANVASNGRLLFTSTDTDYSETVGELTGDGPLIAPLWDDLNPADSDSDGVYVVRYANALGVYWRVAEYGAAASQYVSLLLFYDGFMLFEYDGLTTTDGLIGWSCGTTTTETDLSAQVPHDGAYGIGNGVEAGIFEHFAGAGSSDPNGMEDKVLWLCGTAGDDNDGDGYTDLCGDPDDTDNTVHP